ncbi:MAG TPA: DUF3488 and transglutaminase-like domain-containing protein [Burkholderiaceae bacterium]|nr:DUF3488 and transglutaminase-like domain-containing protein [Burkholderiaceae bacterium]
MADSRATFVRRLRSAARESFAVLWRPLVSSAARDRRDVLLLLGALALVAAPHASHLPWWASTVFWTLWTLRLVLTVLRRPLPGRIVLVPLAAVIAAIAWADHRALLERDAGITFLMMLAGLKLLEMRSRRDVHVVVVLALFLLLTQFMFDQSLPMAALAAVAVVLLFYLLMSAQAVEGDIAAREKLRLTLRIAAQALPLTLAMFLLFPRLEGPLWGVSRSIGRGETGLSDTMSPGSFTELIESGRIAFRVRFDGAPPPRDALYWRGPVFGAFDGRTWRTGAERIDAEPPLLVVEPDSAFGYEVTLEPQDRAWVFVLELPSTPPRGAGFVARLNADMQAVAARPLYGRTRYRARSFTRYALEGDDDDAALQAWLQLPDGFDPRSRRWADELAARLADSGPARSAAGAMARVRAVLDYLRRGGFRYTLSPPALGRDSVDDFLFDTRLGYCEHFASAFVFAMRALQVPARVVTGYQGGEINPSDGYMTVRQSDAHAWAEVWLPRRGWIRVDPTAVVAPLRIERGAPEAGKPEFGLALGAPLAWAHSIRLRWEALENAWNQRVLSYSSERQRQWLSSLGIVPSWQTLALIFSGVLVALLAVIGVASINPRERADPLARLQQSMRRRLEAAGIRIPPHYGLGDTARAVEGRLQPRDEAEARALLAALERARYAALPPHDARARRELARRIRGFRPRAARR